jgi:hypothetical protein
MFVILALGRLRQEDGDFETSLGYSMRLCLIKTNKQTFLPFLPKQKTMSLPFT